jgi:hypothetical protein
VVHGSEGSSDEISGRVDISGVWSCGAFGSDIGGPGVVLCDSLREGECANLARLGGCSGNSIVPSITQRRGIANSEQRRREIFMLGAEVRLVPECLYEPTMSKNPGDPCPVNLTSHHDIKIVSTPATHNAIELQPYTNGEKLHPWSARLSPLPRRAATVSPLAHNAARHATRRRLPLRPVQAQSTSSRLPAIVLPPRHGCNYDIWVLQARQRDPGRKVRFEQLHSVSGCDTETGSRGSQRNGNANSTGAVNLRAKRCGRGSISRRCCRRRRIAIRSDGIGRIRRGRRNYWARLRSRITVIGTYYLNSQRRKCVGRLALRMDADGPSPSMGPHEVSVMITG